MSETDFIQKAKDWAKKFDSLSLFEQIQTLVILKDQKNPLEIELEIASLLVERVKQYFEYSYEEEKRLKNLVMLKNNIKQLSKKETCGVLSPDKTKTCGSPKGHDTEKPSSMHKNENITW